MKTTLLSLCFVMVLAVTGCKKNSDPTPAPQTNSSIVGEYDLGGTETFTANGVAAQYRISATLFVMQTDKPNTYYFLERYAAKESGFFITANGQSFTGERIVDESFPTDGNRWIGYRTTNGQIANNTITYQSETPAFSIQNISQGGRGYYPTTINSMARKVTFTATKK